MQTKIVSLQETLNQNLEQLAQQTGHSIDKRMQEAYAPFHGNRLKRHEDLSKKK
jgi:hypothetical protein